MVYGAIIYLIKKTERKNKNYFYYDQSPHCDSKVQKLPINP